MGVHSANWWGQTTIVLCLTAVDVMTVVADQVRALLIFIAVPCSGDAGPRANINQGQSVVPVTPTQRSP
jgi:hypothetical protein